MLIGVTNIVAFDSTNGKARLDGTPCQWQNANRGI